MIERGQSIDPGSIPGRHTIVVRITLTGQSSLPPRVYGSHHLNLRRERRSAKKMLSESTFRIDNPNPQYPIKRKETFRLLGTLKMQCVLITKITVFTFPNYTSKIAHWNNPNP
jgi:hypothetical protein